MTFSWKRTAFGALVAFAAVGAVETVGTFGAVGAVETVGAVAAATSATSAGAEIPAVGEVGEGATSTDAAAAADADSTRRDAERQEKNLFPKNATILFQGDSITDGGRGRGDDPNHILGHGYAFAIACELGGKYPEQNWTFLNRGVSGDTLVQLKERWDADAVALNPDVLSILIGVNDFWRGGTAEEYRTRYDELLAETKAKLPRTKLIVIEPFVVGDPERVAKMAPFRAAAKELAAKYGAIFVPTQATFEEKVATGPNPAYWIWDGVHPTYSGHWALRDAWLKAVSASE